MTVAVVCHETEMKTYKVDFLNMQKQSERIGLFAFEMWLLKRDHGENICEQHKWDGLGLLPFCLTVFLHVKRKMW